MTRAANSTWYNWHANNALAHHVELLARRLNGTTVIDVGCGDQPYRAFVAHMHNYVGLDTPLRADGGQRADVLADASALPFASSSADGVLCTEVIEHMPDPAQLLAEIHRVLRPEGALLLSAPFTWHVHDEPRDFWRFTEYGLRLICERAGFQVETLRATNGFAGALLQSRAYFLYHVSGRYRPLVRFPVWVLQAIATAVSPLDHNRRMTSNYVLVARKA